MKDPVQGEAYVLSFSDSGASLTVRGPNVPASTVHVDDVPKDRANWPTPGQTLRATIDRSDPSNVEIDWAGPRVSSAPPPEPDPPPAPTAAPATSVSAQPAQFGDFSEATIKAATDAGVDLNQLQQTHPGAQIDVSSWNAMQGGTGSLTDQIKAAMEVAQQYQQAAGQMPTPMTPDTASIAKPHAGDDVDDTLASLEKLVKLRDAGVLTDAEFETAKRKVLED